MSAEPIVSEPVWVKLSCQPAAALSQYQKLVNGWIVPEQAVGLTTDVLRQRFICAKFFQEGPGLNQIARTFGWRGHGLSQRTSVIIRA
jgi:hypothetical protein